MTNDFPVRAAVADDAPALAALVNSAYRGDSSRAGWTTEADLLGGQRVDAERLADDIATPGHVVLLHEVAGQPVACVHLERTTPDGCYLGMLTTQPTLQARGLGRRMLQAAETWAATTWGTRSVHMTVIAVREELIAYYERRGYVRTGERRPFPYDDPRFGLPRVEGLEFVVLRKTLAPSTPQASGA